MALTLAAALSRPVPYNCWPNVHMMHGKYISADWDTNTVWDCNGTASASNPAFCGGRDTENIAYEGAVTANRDPDKYLLKQPDGSLYVSGYVNAHVIDFRKEAGTALWIETCTNATATKNVDGCFADFCSWGLDENSYPGFSAAHNAAVNGLSKAMGEDGLAIGNNCQHDVKTGNLKNWSSPSAVFMEGFSNSSSNFQQLLSFSNTTLWPKPPVVQIHLGSKECWMRVNARPKPGDSLGYGCNNTLAAAMVLLRENVYIGAGNWRGTDIMNRLLPEFGYPLGKPTGPPVVDGSTHTYSRSFTSGTTVTFHPPSGLGEIKWGHKLMDSQSWGHKLMVAGRRHRMLKTDDASVKNIVRGSNGCAAPGWNTSYSMANSLYMYCCECQNAVCVCVCHQLGLHFTQRRCLQTSRAPSTGWRTTHSMASLGVSSAMTTTTLIKACLATPTECHKNFNFRTHRRGGRRRHCLVATFCSIGSLTQCRTRRLFGRSSSLIHRSS
eukprot:SAG25_NODE_87_length_16363_cov_40.489179_3_plen_495_part_00